LNRWIFPVAVFGNSVTKSIQHGYLYGAIFDEGQESLDLVEEL